MGCKNKTELIEIKVRVVKIKTEVVKIKTEVIKNKKASRCVLLKQIRNIAEEGVDNESFVCRLCQ